MGSNVNINYDNVQGKVAEIKRKIQSEIYGGSKASKDAIMCSITNSAGDFMEKFKEELGHEVEIICAVGGLLEKTADFVLSAARDFAAVDLAHSGSQIENTER